MSQEQKSPAVKALETGTDYLIAKSPNVLAETIREYFATNCAEVGINSLDYIKRVLKALANNQAGCENLVSLQNLSLLLHSTCVAQVSIIEMIYRLLETGEEDVDQELYQRIWKVADDYQRFMEEELQREDSPEDLKDILPQNIRSLYHALNASIGNGKVSPAWLEYVGPPLGINFTASGLSVH